MSFGQSQGKNTSDFATMLLPYMEGLEQPNESRSEIAERTFLEERVFKGSSRCLIPLIPPQYGTFLLRSFTASLNAVLSTAWRSLASRSFTATGGFVDVHFCA